MMSKTIKPLAVYNINTDLGQNRLFFHEMSLAVTAQLLHYTSPFFPSFPLPASSCKTKVQQGIMCCYGNRQQQK